MTTKFNFLQKAIDPFCFQAETDFDASSPPCRGEIELTLRRRFGSQQGCLSELEISHLQFQFEDFSIWVGPYSFTRTVEVFDWKNEIKVYFHFDVDVDAFRDEQHLQGTIQLKPEAVVQLRENFDIDWSKTGMTFVPVD